jgi:hypothetical protein
VSAGADRELDVLADWMGAQIGGAARGGATRHIDDATLERHAAGELAPGHAHEISVHLAVCEDGRCLEVLRAHLTDLDRVHEALYEVELGPITREVSHALPLERSVAPTSRPALGGLRARTFQARDLLWEQMSMIADDLGQPVDSVVSDAMMHYADARAQGQPGAISSQLPPSVAPPTLVPPPAPRIRTPPAGAMVPPRSAPLPAQSAFPPEPALSSSSPTSYINQWNRPTQRPGPPPLPVAASSFPPPGPAPRGRLTVQCGGGSTTIQQDRFVIGRAKGACDLVISDFNVSRQHATVERQGEHWFIVDMGSTNGVQYRGNRISRKAIEDGDVFWVCGHELVFTYL